MPASLPNLYLSTARGIVLQNSAASLLEFPIKFGDKEEELTVCLGIAIALIEPQAVVKLRLSIFRSDIFRYFVVFNILIVLLRKNGRQESENIQIYSGLSRQRSFAPRNFTRTFDFLDFLDEHKQFQDIPAKSDL